MRPAAIIVAALLPVMPLVGCSSEPERDCLDVPSSTVDAILDGASGDAMTARASAAVDTDAFDGETVRLVSISFTTPGFEDAPEVGVWAVDDLETPTMILAVDAMAQSFTNWPGQINGEDLDITVDGASDAQACLR